MIRLPVSSKEVWMSNRVELSVVIPLYNEEDSVEPLYAELSPVLNELGRTYEVILVDDGSKDASFARLKAIHDRDPHWKVIRFRRNYGQTAGLSAGFEQAEGDVVITLDADLQNDPRDIPKLLDKMEEGDYDIVSGWRKDRKEPFLSRRLPSMTANWLISTTTGVVLHDYGCTLKAYRRVVTKNIHLYGELHRFIPAVASSIGVTVSEVPVNDRARRFGKSKYGIMRTFRVLLDLITVRFILSYSTRPLQIFGGAGLAMGALGILIGFYLSYVKLILGENIGDRPLLILAVLLLILGVQMVSIGLVAEIVIRTYHESQEKPIYMVREYLGHDSEEVEAKQASPEI
ncbi:MAG: glycosyltransferase family 2 protein [Anaerolineae bacterium]|nr:glycosyltransferase family 2 protein [Anaerolineae bacterium]